MRSSDFGMGDAAEIALAGEKVALARRVEVVE
jgi:hypothetical protein